MSIMELQIQKNRTISASYKGKAQANAVAGKRKKMIRVKLREHLSLAEMYRAGKHTVPEMIKLGYCVYDQLNELSKRKIRGGLLFPPSLREQLHRAVKALEFVHACFSDDSGNDESHFMIRMNEDHFNAIYLLTVEYAEEVAARLRDDNYETVVTKYLCGCILCAAGKGAHRPFLLGHSLLFGAPKVDTFANNL